ncbi:MAG: twin-arginine translocation signal domain-containing protein [Chloroflexi bacterium]|nr:twin-arginine translocation signal domain-containing protein [Chloroflexota bacterium]
MSKLDRRSFMKLMGAGAASIGAGALVGRSSTSYAQTDPTPAAAPLTQEQLDAVTEMDNLHAEGVQIFLDNIGKDELYWNRQLDYTLDGDTKVFGFDLPDGRLVDAGKARPIRR